MTNAFGQRMSWARVAWAGTATLLAAVSVVVAGQGEETRVIGVRVVAFSSDGKLLAAGSGEAQDPGTVTVWDVATRQPLWSHHEPGGIPSVAFAPDGTALAIGSFAPAAKLLDAASGRLRATLPGNGKAARAVGFSPDGKTLAIGSYDRFIKLWDVATRAAGRTLEGYGGRIYTVQFSPDGKLLVCAGEDGVRLWDAASGKEKRLWKHGNFLTPCAVFTPDGRSVLTGGWDGSVRLWDVATGALRVQFQNLAGVDAVAFAPATHTLAVCGNGRDIQLFDLDLAGPSPQDRERIDGLLAKLDEDSYDVREAASRDLLALGFRAEPDLRRAAKEAASAEVRLRARRIRHQLLSRAKGTLSAHTGAVQSAAFTPDGTLLASGGKDGTVRLWDVPARKAVASLRSRE